MEILFDFIAEFKWIVHGLGLLFLLFLLSRMGISILDIMRIFLDEIKQLLAMKYTPGSLNMLGIVSILTFGIIIIISDGSGALINFIKIFVESEKAKDFSKSVDTIYLYYVLVVFSALSVIVVTFKTDD